MYDVFQILSLVAKKRSLGSSIVIRKSSNLDSVRKGAKVEGAITRNRYCVLYENNRINYSFSYRALRFSIPIGVNACTFHANDVILRLTWASWKLNNSINIHGAPKYMLKHPVDSVEGTIHFSHIFISFFATFWLHITIISGCLDTSNGRFRDY